MRCECRVDSDQRQPAIRFEDSPHFRLSWIEVKPVECLRGSDSVDAVIGESCVLSGAVDAMGSGVICSAPPVPELFSAAILI